MNRGEIGAEAGRMMALVHDHDINSFVPALLC
jgi:hypothetical protein